jgi:hypothetical protein
MSLPEDVTQNADGTRNLIAGKSLMAIIAAIQAEPGITGPALVAKLQAQGSELKAGSVENHIERLHLRMAIAKRPSTAPYTGRGRAPLGLHWTGAYTVIDGEALAAQRKQDEANKPHGAPRVRSSMTAEECLAKATQLEGEAATLWQGYNFSDTSKPRSEFETFVAGVRAKVERAAGLRFRAQTVLPAIGSMTFAPEPEAPAAAPAAPVASPEQVAEVAPAVSPEGGVAVEAPKPSKRRK